MTKSQESERERLAAIAKDLLSEADRIDCTLRAGGDPDSTGRPLERHKRSAFPLWDMVGGAAASASGIYRYLVTPFAVVVGPPFRWLFRAYLLVWRRFVYVNSGNSGERVLSRWRVRFAACLTVLLLLAASPTSFGSAIRFVTFEPLLDGIMMGLSMEYETFYLNNSEEISPEENIHSVRGCRSQGQCAEGDAVYFRIQPRFAHDLWKLLKHGNPFYVPDHVVAPIAPGVNRCEVTYYGYRMTASWVARLLRSLQFYPTMLEAKCTHLGERGEE